MRNNVLKTATILKNEAIGFPGERRNARLIYREENWGAGLRERPSAAEAATADRFRHD
jgi:hypothetical protein